MHHGLAHCDTHFSFYHGLYGILSCAVNGVPGLPCATGQEEHPPTFNVAAVITALITALVCILGLYSDAKLYLFLKSGNLTKESKLVPWKSNVKQEDASVPKRATTMGVISFLVLAVSASPGWKSTVMSAIAVL